MALIALIGLTLVGSACGGGGTKPPAADGQTAALAAVQAAHLCDVAVRTYPRESDIKAALVARLEAEGTDYATWKRWNDSLEKAPTRAEQLADAIARGC